MKNLITLALLAISLNAQAQFQMEKEYKKCYWLDIVKFENVGEKYLILDTTQYTIWYYNDDHTLWKKIIVPTVPGYTYLNGANYSSTKLFNDDSKIEVLVYYKNDNTSIIDAVIINEDGTILYTFNTINASAAWVREINGKWKLILAENKKPYDYQIWSLPGSYSGIEATKGGGGSSSVSSAMLYPNPVENSATLAYKLPDGTSEAQLNIYNSSGQVVRTYTVTNQFGDIIINKGTLAPGNYTYSLSGSDFKTAEQFIIK